jgi:hypothetical protein
MLNVNHRKLSNLVWSSFGNRPHSWSPISLSRGGFLSNLKSIAGAEQDVPLLPEPAPFRAQHEPRAGDLFRAAPLEHQQLLQLRQGHLRGEVILHKCCGFRVSVIVLVLVYY